MIKKSWTLLKRAMKSPKQPKLQLVVKKKKKRKKKIVLALFFKDVLQLLEVLMVRLIEFQLAYC